MQLEMIKAFEQLDSEKPAIGMEMFYRQHQPALDLFVFGTEEQGGGSFPMLRRRTRWQQTWGYDFNQYAKVLSYARRHRLRVVGLNVPYPLVRLVAEGGVESLPSKLREQLPQLDVGNREHFERFVASVLSQNEGQRLQLSQRSLQNYYQATTLWDEYMAASIAAYTHPAPGGSFSAHVRGEAVEDAPPRRMIVLAGSTHVRGRVGVPDRYTRRTGDSTFTMVPQCVAWAESGVPAIERPLSAKEADWIFYTQEEIQLPFGAVRTSKYAPRISADALRLGMSGASVMQI